MGLVYFFALTMAIFASFLLDHEVRSVFIEMVRGMANIGVMWLLIHLLTDKKGDFQAISYIYQIMPGLYFD